VSESGVAERFVKIKDPIMAQRKTGIKLGNWGRLSDLLSMFLTWMILLAMAYNDLTESE